MVSIVDDDKSIREATQVFVQSLGYAVSTFASAEEFLRSDYIRDTSCLITDVQLTGISGIGLQDQLIADGHGIPVIFVTAFIEEEVRARALK